ncbi:isoleucine--tRNA ligase [Siphonobacter sp. SORGH_AS_1065]|uniref:isoleucine--tRNA ligase n=1 Tax=Siphonobacter sp. SORGH_AS_1065 TaxID=3041795 RepID=UPI00277FE90B|nr:isoleucine--tRNA ligase [Siphonobacter sp. SORGH_AS_1065]MDQ1086940.1 isoleucyl-tRNA synthetase [Siphonobacter sp. SORGH_AS_1065]
MNFPEYKNLDYAAVADEIRQFWKENRIFEQSIELREGKPSFTFYEGPPSANGTPGIHHVMARSIKDIFCRYQTLKGRQVKRKGGWDTHGLPIELQVEKELGITKEDIGKKISVEEYNRKCRETVMRYTDQWNDLTEKMGYWVDLDSPYVTYHNEYIESVWHLLKRLHEQGLLYKGYTIQPYSPAAGTGLSSHELNQPGTYKEVKDVSIVAQFKVKLTGKSGYLFDAADSDEIYILAWTTTPWTLPSNSALTVGKNITYQLIQTYNPYTHLPVNVVCAKDRVAAYFPEKGKEGDLFAYQAGDKVIPWKVLMDLKGEHLEGIEYEQLMPYVQPETPAFRVILGDFVTTEDGTGVVHTAPTFGADDFRVAQQNGIPAIMVKDETGKDVPLVDKRGRFVKEVTDFAEEFVKEQYLSDAEKETEREKQGRDKYLSVDERIGILLKTENKAFNVQKFDHTYPHCWRTDKPVLYYPLDSWFIRTTAKKDELVALNKTINWKPESTGTGRFGNWLENLVDWNLSRSRYWGTPLPIWRSEDGEEVCIGSIEELKAALTNALASPALTAEQKASNESYLAKVGTGDFDLHRPYVDDIYFVSASGKVMKRESDLIDVWFDSGAMPYAQWHYPFENQDIFEKSYPADFISEGVDQTRGWFFTLHAISGMLNNSVAFKNVVSTGLVLDKDGEKMSKRKGNVINPFEALGKYGTDPIRWYMITNSNPWDNLRFNLEGGVTEVRNKFFGTLTNTYNFFALYANLDGYTADEANRVPYEQLSEMDRWILSKLNSLIKDVDGFYADYEPTKAGRAIQDFVSDHLSNWYVRLSRRRFWKGELTADKRAAFETLQECLLKVAQLMSPIAPFYSDWLYRNLTIGNRDSVVASVHLTDLQASNHNYIDPELEASMELAQRVSSLVHSIRKVNKIKVRQPLSRVLVPVLNEYTKQRLARVEELIKAEVNVKAVELLDDASGVLNKKVKPNFKALGPKFGPKMKEVAAGIQAMSTADIAELEKAGTLTVGGAHEITVADVEILTEDLPGFLTAQENGLTVALDVSISEELRHEGIAREFVNRIQNLRKDSGFEVADKISISVSTTEELVKAALEANREYICTEVQALSLNVLETLTDAVTVDLDEVELNVKVEVVS